MQWTLDFGPDSVTIALNDLDQNRTISSQEITLAAWQLLLSQREDFLNNHLARVPLEDIKFNWEDSQLDMDMDAVFRPGIDTPFSPTTFNDLLMGDGSVENPIALNEEQVKENAPPPTTPESVRPTETHRLQRSRAFGVRMENVPDYVFRKLFH